MVIALPATPACMSPDELVRWERGNGYLSGTKSGRAASPCEDCTLGYAADMRAIGRCDGTPGGVEEDDMETTSPPVTLQYGGHLVATKARVTIVAPCATCIHARVCRLQPRDELVVTAELPDIADELAFTLTATVECSEYARAPKVKAIVAPRGSAPESARAWNGGPIQALKRHTMSDEGKARIAEANRLRAEARRREAVEAAQ